MFTIVISEKGGAERRESFEKNEINVGRVQGNDLMLPKGNVSKHHARLLFRDARFIVTDLKSTNGTYVNGRKISQATIVREGDKIYIGDFVLRLETGSAGAHASGDAADSRTPPRNAPARESVPGAPPLATAPVSGQTSPPPASPAAPFPGQASASPAGSFVAATAVPIGSAPVLASAPVGSSGALAAASAASPVLASPLAAPPRPSPEQSVSHFPLERDPDDSEAAPEMPGAPVPRVPGPPRVPAADPGARPRTGTALIIPADKPPVPARSTAPVPAAAAAAGGAKRSVAPPPNPVDSRPLPRETPHHAVRALALRTLVERVMDAVDPAWLAQPTLEDDELTGRLERSVREQAKAMRDGGQAPESIDLESLSRDALREILGLGPIGPLLADDDVLEIQVLRPEYVLVSRAGQPSLAEAPFTSGEALARVVRRLAHLSGHPLGDGEVLVERTLPHGARLVAIGPPVAATWTLSLRKRRRVEATMEGLVRAGGLSRPIASFLDACIAGKLNLLVVGSPANTLGTMLSALGSAFPASERVVAVQDAEDIVIDQTQVVPVALPNYGLRGEEAVRFASRLGGDRLLFGSLGGSVTAAAVDAIAAGADGVLAGAAAPSLRRGLGRLASQLVLARPGTSLDAARRVLADSFDVAVEVLRTGDGRIRVQRVAELRGDDQPDPRDIFVCGEGVGEAAFAATGAIPRLREELEGRGVKLDPALFRKT